MSSSRAWKQFEGMAAALFGGRRAWSNSGERLDFETPTAVGQCKLVQKLSLESLTQLAEEMAREGQAKLKWGVVVVKVRRGRGRPSTALVVMTSDMWQRLNGTASEQNAHAYGFEPEKGDSRAPGVRSSRDV